MRVLVVDNYDSFAYNLVQYVGTVVAAPGAAADSQGSGTGTASRDAGTAGDDRPATTGAPDDGHGQVVVRRNDEITLDGVDALDPDAVVVSPGPGTPAEAGVSVALFAERSYPTLGVCLGHQALCAANGAEVGHADAVVHGKPSTVTHDGKGVFGGLPERFEVGRYHSLAVEREALPDALVETARTVDVADAADRESTATAADEGSGESPDAAAATESAVVMGVRHRDRPHVGVQFHPESILTDHGERLVANFLATYARPAAATDR